VTTFHLFHLFESLQTHFTVLSDYFLGSITKIFSTNIKHTCCGYTYSLVETSPEHTLDYSG